MVDTKTRHWYRSAVVFMKIEGLNFPLLTNSNTETRFGSHGGIFLILLVFFSFLLPVLSQVSTYHSDEHYYTDSAIYMLLHQDCLNPHLVDGTLRTKKPIITYWAMMAGYTLLGINFFAARLPFLIAGGMTLWLTYHMAITLLGNRREGLLAAAILASNLQFVVLCLRATPDILNTLFLNISLYGFIALIFQRDLRLRNYIYAYCGAALAIETKGLLGITSIAFAFLFLLVSKDSDIRFRSLINWPVVGLSAVLAVSWYAFILVQHGQGALFSFYSDQVGGKLGGSRYYILMNIKDYLWGIFRNFLPWSLVLAAGYTVNRKPVNAFFGAHRRAVLFIAGWLALLLIIFMVSNDCRTRYLVPAYPLLSVLFAALFGIVIEHKKVAHLWTWCCGVLLVLLVVCGAVALLGGAVMDWRLAIAGLILLGVSVPGMLRLIRYRRAPMPVWMGLIMLIALAGLRGFALPVFEFAPSEQLTACILRNTAADQSISVWATRRQNYTQQLYALSKGRISMHYFPRRRMPDDLDNRSPVILTGRDKKTLSLGEYTIEQCGFVFQAPNPQNLWEAILRGEKEAALNTLREPLYLAWRRNDNRPGGDRKI
jgi:4-amino-4-deoxy-L-arabinose transferase-like glycosyltransferase